MHGSLTDAKRRFSVRKMVTFETNSDEEPGTREAHGSTGRK